MRSDNLRAAPRWITPEIVGRVLSLAMPVAGQAVPVVQVPTPGVKPRLAIVEKVDKFGPPPGGKTRSGEDGLKGESEAGIQPAMGAPETDSPTPNPPVASTHSRRSEEREAASNGPTPAASPRRPKPRPTDWSGQEDDRLRAAYANGDRIDLLAGELGRTTKGTYSRAKKIGLTHPRDIKGGFVQHPSWSKAEDELLRQLYGTVPTSELPARIGRTRAAIFARANVIGLDPGYRQWTRNERRALRIAHSRRIAVADLAATLDRNAFAVSKYATNHGYSFGRRNLLAEPITLEALLALDDPDRQSPSFRPRRAEIVAERQTERAAAADRRRQERDQAKEEVRRKREQDRAARAAARKQKRSTVAAASVVAPAAAFKAPAIETGTAPRVVGAAPARKTPCEVEPPAPRQTARSAPSREPALPAVQQARAQPFVVRQTPGAPRYINYAEKMNAAVAHLRARNFVVQRHSRDEIIARWHVSGWTGLFSNEDLVALAVHHGLEFAA